MKLLVGGTALALCILSWSGGAQAQIGSPASVAAAPSSSSPAGDVSVSATLPRYRPYVAAGWTSVAVAWTSAVMSLWPQFLAAGGDYPFASIVPVVGPIATAVCFYFDDDAQRLFPEAVRMTQGLLFLSGAVQALGLSLAIVGHVRGARHRQANRSRVAISFDVSGIRGVF